MRGRAIAAAVAVGCIAAAPAGSTAYALSGQDKAYMTKAAHDDSFERAAGQMALQRGGSASIKNLGSRLIRDHNTDLVKLKALAGKLGVTLPDGPDGYQSKQLRAFADASTVAQLDAKIRAAVIAAHRISLANAQREVRAGSNASVKALARAAVPMIQAHLRLAAAAR
jgi:putative membrane protein